MKIKVVKKYYDRNLEKEMEIGTELTATKERATKLIERKLAEEVKADKKG